MKVTGAPIGIPTKEALHAENLQVLQIENIQEIITRLKTLVTIPVRNRMPQVLYATPTTTQGEDAPNIFTKPDNVVVEYWEWMAEV